VAGDFFAAHQCGVDVSRRAYGVRFPQPVGIVIVSPHPCDIDYWQAGKGIIAAYFAV
jgi:nickel-dependent lactate racemase